MTHPLRHRLMVLMASVVGLIIAGCEVSPRVSEPPEPPASMSWQEGIAYSESMVGFRAPDFTVNASQTGAPEFTLSEATAEGDVVVLAFWIRDCQACTRDMPRLAELVEWTREEGLPVAVVAVHNVVHTSSASSRLMPDEASIAEYADTIDFYMEGANDDFDSVYGVRSWPRIFVIDADGIITYVKAYIDIDLLAQLKEQVEIAGAG